MTDPEFQPCEHICACGSCDRCCDGQCRFSDEAASPRKRTWIAEPTTVDGHRLWQWELRTEVGRIKPSRSSDESEQR